MSFAAPLFLLAALAGLIPVVLHLINRQKATVMPFSTLRFLRQSVEQTRRRKYLHDVSLLTLRVAGLLLIALALARPTVRQLRHLLGGKSSTAVAIVLDNSASMGCIDQGGPRWSAGLRAVEQLLDLTADADAAALLVCCGPPLAQARQLFRNQEVLRQALGAVKLSYERADLPAAIDAARDLLQKSDAANQEIYVVTDMQRVSWEGLTAAAEATGQPPVILVDVRQSPKPNAAVAAVKLAAAAPVAGAAVQVTATVRGDPQTRQQRRLELVLDGKQQATSPSLTIDAGAEVQHSFPFAFEQPGLHHGEVRLAGEDACEWDDRCHFAIDVNPQLTVALVQTGSHEIPYLDDAFYLRRALDPGGNRGWAIRTASLNVEQLPQQSLAEYAVVFCINLPALDSDVAQQLADYIAAGGHVVWVCGDNVDPVSYNAMNERTQGRLLPARLGRVQQASGDHVEGWPVTRWDAQHPALAPLSEPASLYQSVVVRQYVELAPLTGEEPLTVLAGLSDGQPLLVQRNVGSGSVLLFGASMHADWSNLPLRPIFLPLIVRLTFHLAGAKADQPSVVAGSPLVVPLPPTVQAVQLTTPAGASLRVDAPSGQEFRFTDTHQTGLYEVELIDPLRPRRVGFAVNPDPREMDASTVTPEELTGQFGSQPLVFCQQPEQLWQVIRGLREGRSLWAAFLMALLVALVAESFLANRR